MSHLPQRKEKICLNCEAELISRYCQECGQENVEPKENAWHLITHFFNDITHFDGKFFSSLKHLVLRPGFLTEEYIKGRRARYLNPIRMYLFISAVFFLLYASFFSGNVKVKDTINASSGTKSSKPEKSSIVPTGVKNAAIYLDTTGFEEDEALVPLRNGDSITQKEVYRLTSKDLKSYDSIQSLLPASEQHGKLGRYFSRKMLAAFRYKTENSEEADHRIKAYFFHSMPYMLFASLPILALLLKVLYIRRKQYYYVAHSIFIIHYFSFLFIAILVIRTLRSFEPWGSWPALAILLGAFVYLYFAMRRFYKQGVLRTLMKYILFNTVSIIFFMVLFFGLLISSFFSLV